MYFFLAKSGANDEEKICSFVTLADLGHVGDFFFNCV